MGGEHRLSLGFINLDWKSILSSLSKWQASLSIYVNDYLKYNDIEFI